MKSATVSYIITELSKEEYGNTSIVINMKSGATIYTIPSNVSLNKECDCLAIASEDDGTKWLDVDSIEYIEI